MSIYDSELWIRDLDQVLAILPELRALEGRNVMITGATGLVCSAVTDILIRYNETHENRIRIHAAGRSAQRMQERFSEFFDRDYFHFFPYDSSRPDNRFDFPCDKIIHGAANSSPRKIVDEPVETMLGNFLGMKCLLDFARESKADRVLYISSSEVYGKKDRLSAAKEDDYGFIDVLVPRNAYSIGKQAAETLCVSYAEEYGVESVIVRPGHIYGPTAGKNDDHVSSAWAYEAARGNDIVMKSDGDQVRSYVYCLDCASAILKTLLCGESGQAYNISNPDSIISIREMAELLCRAGDVALRRELANAQEKKGFNPMRSSALDSSRLMGLGWRGCFDAETGFSHTVKILRETAC